MHDYYSKPSGPVRPSATDKKVARTHYKDSRRSGDFQRDLLDLWHARTATGTTATIVGEGSSSSLPPVPSSASPSPLDLIVLERGREPFNFPLSGKGRDADGLPAHVPTKALHPGPWRDQHDEIHVLCYHLALKRLAASQGRLVAAVTVRLRDDVEARARAKGYQCSAWLRSEFTRHLKRALGYKPDFYFVVEEINGKDMHVHVEIALDVKPSRWKQGRYFAEVRRALRKAAGEWPGHGHKYQVRFDAISPDAGWPGYICKGLAKSRLERRRFMKRLGADHRYEWHNRFEGSAIACTHPVAREAKAIYEELAKEVLAYRAVL